MSLITYVAGFTPPTKNLMKTHLKEPYKQIQENAGGSLEIKLDIFDPTKVVRVALENACSVASILLTTEAAVVEKNDEIEVAVV